MTDVCYGTGTQKAPGNPSVSTEGNSIPKLLEYRNDWLCAYTVSIERYITIDLLNTYTSSGLQILRSFLSQLSKNCGNESNYIIATV